MNQLIIRNNGFKLEKVWSEKEIGKNWLPNQIVDVWIGLHNQAVDTELLGRELQKKIRQIYAW